MRARMRARTLLQVLILEWITVQMPTKAAYFACSHEDDFHTLMPAQTRLRCTADRSNLFLPTVRAPGELVARPAHPPQLKSEQRRKSFSCKELSTVTAAAVGQVSAKKTTFVC